MCSQGKTKQWLCLGTVASEREARHGEGSHTQRKIETERGRENESGRVGERVRERERERGRTLPGGSFFLSAIINGILPLTHSSLRQTKDPAFQCSLTGQPASHPTTVEPHHSPQLDRSLIMGVGLSCAVETGLRTLDVLKKTFLLSTSVDNFITADVPHKLSKPPSVYFTWRMASFTF